MGKMTLVLFDSRKIVVPKGARDELLSSLHVSHSGEQKTWETARDRFFWPSLKSQISQMFSECEACTTFLPARKKEKLKASTKDMTILEPMDEISVDLFHLDGRDHLAMVDRVSGFLRQQRLSKTDSVTVQDALSCWWCEVGRSRVVKTDGGPQFRAKFTTWLGDLGVAHQVSSPCSLAANGLAKNAVRQIKLLLKKTKLNKECFNDALLHYNATKRSSGAASPGSIVYKRAIRTSVSGLANQLFDLKEAREER
jgi:hypothetical protein